MSIPDTLNHIHTTAIWRTVAVLLSAFTDRSALYRQNRESLHKAYQVWNMYAALVVLTHREDYD